jgi:hypothetical protein
VQLNHRDINYGPELHSTHLSEERLRATANVPPSKLYTTVPKEGIISIIHNILHNINENLTDDTKMCYVFIIYRNKAHT